MDERVLKWVFDIKSAIADIDSYFDTDERNFFEYQSNYMRKKAIERALEVIGEATNRIITKDKAYLLKISEAKSIIGLRNQIIHAYDNVSDEMIWSILITHLPRLKTEILSIIKEAKG